MPSLMWNWQLPDWPNFRYDSQAIRSLESEFMVQSGVLTGALRHVEKGEQQQLVVEMMGEEALRTSEIEGEMLDRDSLQSSIRRHFGLSSDHRRVPAAEQGMSQMQTEVHRDYAQPLSHQMLHGWHRLLMNGRRDLECVGEYRKDPFPMQIVSGPVSAPRVHFEAPPSSQVGAEMEGYMRWYEATSLQGSSPLPLLARAGLAHLYFESIHPYEDGNGRLGRAIVQKALSEGLGHAVLIALSTSLQQGKKLYYQHLERSSRGLEVTEWLVYFSQVILSAQSQTLALVDFLIQKTRYYLRLGHLLNERQHKVLARVFEAGPGGFTGGISAEKYLRITGCARATATRDLLQLVEHGAVQRTGQGKGTRYWLKL